jgi:hypothetical protein
MGQQADALLALGPVAAVAAVPAAAAAVSAVRALHALQHKTKGGTFLTVLTQALAKLSHFILGTWQ